MNPFVFGKPATGEFFCPRPEIEAQLDSLIKANEKIYIFGRSKMGKTSLVKEVSRKMSSTHYLVYVDLKLLESAEDLERRIVLGLIESEMSHKSHFEILQSYSSYNPAMTVDSLSGEPQFVVKKTDETDVSEMVQFLNKFTPIKDMTPIICFDNFQEIHSLDKKVLNELINGLLNNKTMAHIFVETENLFEENSAASSLSSALPEIKVKSIDSKEYKTHVEKHLAKFNPPAKLLDEAFKVAGENTGDRQQLFNALYESLEQDPAFNKNKLKIALKNVFAKTAESFELIFSDLTPVQKKILKALAFDEDAKIYSKEFSEKVGPTATNTIPKTLTALVRRKLLYKDGKQMKFGNVFFREWIKSSFQP